MTITAICPHCGHTQQFIILTGLRAAIWDQTRALYREGDIINTQIVADMVPCARSTVARHFQTLEAMGLVELRRKRNRGRRVYWHVARKHSVFTSHVTPHELQLVA
jgi:DNA-binding MarR family transcriptional regulator